MRRHKKKRLVGQAALDELARRVEEAVKSCGLYDEWLQHIGHPGNKGLDDAYLSTDNDWPIRMASWYLDRTT